LSTCTPSADQYSLDKFFLNKDDAVIVIVDIQERLAAVMDDRPTVVSNCLHLIEAAKLLGIPVLITEQYPKGLGPSVGEIREAIPSYRPIEKITFSCCREPRFVESLSASGKKKVILAGMETHVCVLQTCLGLFREGYTVHVAADAVCSRSKVNSETGLAFMRDAGAVVTCAETVLFQLLEKAGTEEFRAISKLIK
jgi:nicotinamidase-related amidase